MPRFMVMLKGNDRYEQGVTASKEVQDEMSAYNEELVRAGIRLAAEGLQPSSKGARVIFSEGGTKVLDGPFAEAKELVAGFWILQCRSLDECIEWIKRVPVGPMPGHTGAGEIEIRQIYEADDFGSDGEPLRN